MKGVGNSFTARMIELARDVSVEDAEGLIPRFFHSLIDAWLLSLCFECAN